LNDQETPIGGKLPLFAPRPAATPGIDFIDGVFESANPDLAKELR
jgi:hypothetical protein